MGLGHTGSAGQGALGKFAITYHIPEPLNEAAPELAIANMRALTSLAATGALRPRISHRLPLARAAEALQAVIDRKVIGKAVLVS